MHLVDEDAGSSATENLQNCFNGKVLHLPASAAAEQMKSDTVAQSGNQWLAGHLHTLP